MTREEKVKKLEDLRKQDRELMLTKNALIEKGQYKKAKAIYMEVNPIWAEEERLVAELERDAGLIWDSEEWVTAIISDDCKSYEEARKNLLEKLSKMHGVTIIDGGSGVKTVEVLTKNKVYRYQIHGSTCVKVLNSEKVTEYCEDFDTDITYEKEETEVVCIAYCSKNIFNAFRNKYYF